MQQGMLFHSLYAPEDGVYFVQSIWRMQGNLNVEAFAQAWQQVVERHPILRTAFMWSSSDKPLQVVYQEVKIPLEIHDWRGLSTAQRERQLETFLLSHQKKGFQLSLAPLMRLTLIEVGEEVYQFVWSFHHLLLDGWSLPPVIKEVFTFYEAFCTGTDVKLEPVRHYRDYIAWLLKQDLALAEVFWRQTLKGFIAPTPLTVDRASTTLLNQHQRYSEQSIQLTVQLTEELKSFARQHQLTLSTLVQGAWAILLSRYSGEADVVFGVTVSGRSVAIKGVESIVGLLINTLPMRVIVSTDDELIPWLYEIQNQLQQMNQYEYSPLVQIQQWSEVPQGVPLFESLVVFENYPASDATCEPNLNLQISDVRSLERTNYPLTVVAEPGTQLSLHLKYDCQRFDDATIARMAGHFQTLLEGIVANPQQQVSQLPLLTLRERHQLLVEWNNTTKEYPQDKCIHQLFEEQVELTPEAVAVVFEDKQLTYLQLNQRANKIAHHLKTLGVGPEVLVGLCVERSLEMIVGLLGILKAGGAYVPLDPAYPKDRLSHMLLDSQASVVLTSEKLVVQLPEHTARVVGLDTDWDVIEQMSQENPLTNVQATNLAYVIYTSGSTGKPKGITIEHRSVLNLATGLHQAIYARYQDSQLRVSVNGSLSFDTSVKQIIQLLYGHTLLIVPEATRFDGNALLSFLQKHKIDVFDCTPSQLYVLIAAGLLASKSAPKALLVGGEKIDESTWLALQQTENINFYNVYGPTECTVDATVGSVKMAGSKPIIGRPITNTQIYILDRHLQPVGVGVAGELYIGGHGLARGYLNRPDLTDEKFIPNPFNNEPSSRLYKTGDKARYLPDGNIEFLSRIDNQVKIRGFRIELGEIEAAIAQHPGVRETVVIAREDVPGHKYLVAYIVPNHSDALASSDLRSFLSEKLPDYMIPGVFVHLDALPLTPNGKVDRKALPIPGTARQELQAESAPRTRAEEILAQIWREVFHRDILSIHDNFFELGGDSILSIQIIFKANRAGLVLTPKQIFQHQTIAELAAVATTFKTLKAFQGLVTGSLPLTPIQHRFFAQNLSEPHHFNQAFLLLFPPTLNPDLLQQALQQLLLHHDALRLRFNQTEAGWQQFNVLPDEIVPFSLIDLSTLQEEALSQTIESTSSQLQASLNLNSGPLLRVALFHLGTQKPSRLLLVIHHLAVDGVSWRILLEDLQTAYQQLESGKPIQLPAKTTSFKHWAEKLTQYAQSPAATKELTYWSNISTPKITHLPVDSKGGANTKASARSVKVSLTSDETRALLQGIHKAYHTQINDILLTALVQVLATWSGSESVIIDLEGHGREEILPDVDLSRTVGWFTTIFPVHLELKATENLPDAIESIKEQLRAIPNRGISYGVLRYLSRDAEITSQLFSLPQAEVSFNYLGQFDWGMQSDSFIKLASESVGSEHSQLGHRSHLLEINGLVVENQLQLEWTYSENFHTHTTIESLAQDFAASLRTLIAHCLSAHSGGDTPDVFENQTIHREAQSINNDQRQENNVPLPLHLLELSPEISELLPLDTEAAYPLAKMQEFMLQHYVNDTQKMGVYHCQQSYDIDDDSLDLNAFKKALLILVQKHPALRTVFITFNGFPAVQVVKKNLIFSITEQDISHIKSEEQSNYIDAVMKQDRQNLFDVENPNEPLFRFRIFQKAENKFEFLMSIHHAITDGWGNIEFHNELYEIYSDIKKGEEITVVPAANVYKEFVALEKEIIGSLDVSNFWKLHLKDHTYKPLKSLTSSVEQGESVTEKYNFDSEVVVNLRELCQKLRVSPKALFLSTYLDLIGTVMKSNRVCVGVVSNGRTERLSDPFGALGLFWNIVPFCQQTREDKGVQIKNVQQSLIDIEPYVRYPLLQILSDQQKPELFFATFNFVNFHNAKNINAETGLKVKDIRFHDKFNFPLNYAVSMSPVEGNVSLSVEYDKLYFSRQEIRFMIQNYVKILKHTINISELY
jgi:amino acid adenylation domain-containing protein/non-ribosomal peptide synthase protein (TIGR01720 family)